VLSVTPGGRNARKTSKPHTAPRDVPPALIRLPFPFQHALQHFAPLLGLPDLIGILVLIELEKLLVSLQRKLRLVQLIVANRADKPDARARLFHFGYLVERHQRRRIISSQKKRGAEVFPISEILVIQPQPDTQLFLRGSKVALLKQHAPQPAVQLRVVGSEYGGLAKRNDGIVPFFLGDLDIGPQLERLEGRYWIVGAAKLELRDAVEFG